MPITGTHEDLIELTDEQAIVQSPGKFFRPVVSEIGPLPDDQHILTIGVAVSSALDEAERTTLEAAIEAISGVQKAVVLISGKTPTTGRVPVTHEMHLQTQSQIILKLI